MRTKLNRQEHGFQAESRVADYLVDQGFIILERNYRQKVGEIDLIARDKELVVFVEVKSRTSQFFDLTQLIQVSKQKRIISTAKYFMASYGYHDYSWRFDVAIIGDARTGSILYVPDAFSEQSY